MMSTALVYVRPSVLTCTVCVKKNFPFPFRSTDNPFPFYFLSFAFPEPFNFRSFLVRVPFLKTAVRDPFCAGTRSVLSCKRPFAIRFSAGVKLF